jgi:SNF2 family DNA or RNA helicase
MEMLGELLQDARESGHRVLVFSQFTAMLEIIETALEKEKVPYFYLNGATKAEDRRDMVKKFNDGENDVFLISLKAGGTGLNLTGADMVVHVDPWWNPAVEDQATDRAYRIGQKNVVQVFKLITKNSIEEKIFELQQKKKQLIDSVIKPGETFISKMTVNDIRSLFE